jgi:hypothetical protein
MVIDLALLLPRSTRLMVRSYALAASSSVSGGGLAAFFSASRISG